jgi:hypothetical protein
VLGVSGDGFHFVPCLDATGKEFRESFRYMSASLRKVSHVPIMFWVLATNPDYAWSTLATLFAAISRGNLVPLFCKLKAGEFRNVIQSN